MKSGEKGFLFFISLIFIVVILSSSFISAGWFSDVWGKITGKAVSDVAACPNTLTSTVSCFFDGNALNNAAGQVDWPPTYTSAKYPYEFYLDVAAEVKMNLRYAVWNRTGSEANTFYVKVDNTVVFTNGESNSNLRTAEFSLGQLSQGIHTISIYASPAPGFFMFDWFNLTKVVSAPVTCTSFTYSAWSPTTCPSSGIQTRTIILNSGFPAGCTGGSPVLTQTCTFATTCVDSDGFNLSRRGNITTTNSFFSDYCVNATVVGEYLCDSSGVGFQNITSCPSGKACLEGACNIEIVNPITCTSFIYSTWSPSTCPSSGTQTRTVASSSPSGCTGGTPVLTQTCTPTTISNVTCMNEGGQETILDDRGNRQISCTINTNIQQTYSLNIKQVESLSGVSTANVQAWILNQDWTGIVSPGQKIVPVLTLGIPEIGSETILKIQLEEAIRETGGVKSHILYVKINPNSLTSPTCTSGKALNDFEGGCCYNGLKLGNYSKYSAGTEDYNKVACIKGKLHVCDRTFYLGYQYQIDSSWLKDITETSGIVHVLWNQSGTFGEGGWGSFTNPLTKDILYCQERGTWEVSEQKICVSNQPDYIDQFRLCKGVGYDYASCYQQGVVGGGNAGSSCTSKLDETKVPQTICYAGNRTTINSPLSKDWVYCPNGCQDGVCLAGSTTTTSATTITLGALPCVDSDGESVLIKGNVTGVDLGTTEEAYLSEDFCLNEGIVMERICTTQNNLQYKSAKEIPCPTGTACVEGACVATTATPPVVETPTQTQLESQVIPVEVLQAQGRTCDGCQDASKCYPLGYRTAINFCSTEGFIEQKEKEASCNNSFECSSNLCIDSKCVEKGFFTRIIEWFRRLFGGN